MAPKSSSSEDNAREIPAIRVTIVASDESRSSRPRSVSQGSSSKDDGETQEAIVRGENRWRSVARSVLPECEKKAQELWRIVKSSSEREDWSETIIQEDSDQDSTVSHLIEDALDRTANPFRPPPVSQAKQSRRKSSRSTSPFGPISPRPSTGNYLTLPPSSPRPSSRPSSAGSACSTRDESRKSLLYDPSSLPPGFIPPTVQSASGHVYAPSNFAANTVSRPSAATEKYDEVRKTLFFLSPGEIPRPSHVAGGAIDDDLTPLYRKSKRERTPRSLKSVLAVERDLKDLESLENDPGGGDRTAVARLFSEYSRHQHRQATQRLRDEQAENEKLTLEAKKVLDKTRQSKKYGWKDKDINLSESAERLHGDYKRTKDRLDEVRRQRRQKEMEECKKILFRPKINKRGGMSADMFGSGKKKTAFERLFEDGAAVRKRKEEARKEVEEDRDKEVQEAIIYGKALSADEKSAHAGLQREHAWVMYQDHTQRIQARAQKGAAAYAKEEAKLRREAQKILDLSKPKRERSTDQKKDDDAPGEDEGGADKVWARRYADPYRKILVSPRRVPKKGEQSAEHILALSQKFQEDQIRRKLEEGSEEAGPPPKKATLKGRMVTPETSSAHSHSSPSSSPTRKSMIHHSPGSPGVDEGFSPQRSLGRAATHETIAEEGERAGDEEEEDDYDPRAPYHIRSVQEYNRLLAKKAQRRIEFHQEEQSTFRRAYDDFLQHARSPDNEEMASMARQRQKEIEAEAEDRAACTQYLLDQKESARKAYADRNAIPGLKILGFISAGLEKRFGFHIATDGLDGMRESIAEALAIYERAFQDVENKEFLYLKKLLKVPNLKRIEGMLKTTKEIAGIRREPEQLKCESAEGETIDDLLDTAKEVMNSICSKITHGAPWKDKSKSIETDFCGATSAYCPGLKKRDRIQTKAEVRYGHLASGRNELVFDIVRVSLEYASCNDLIDGIDKVKKCFHVMDIRNHFAHPKMLGQRSVDILALETRDRDKIVVEIRLELLRYVTATIEVKSCLNSVSNQLMAALMENEESSGIDDDMMKAVTYQVHDIICGPPEERRLRYFKAKLDHRYGTIVSAWRRAFQAGPSEALSYNRFMTVCNELLVQDIATYIWDGLTQGCGGSMCLWNLDPVAVQSLVRLKRLIIGEDKPLSPGKAFKKMIEDAGAAWQDGLSQSEFLKMMKKKGFTDDAQKAFELIEQHAGAMGYLVITDIIWLSTASLPPQVLDVRPLTFLPGPAEQDPPSAPPTARTDTSKGDSATASTTASTTTSPRSARTGTPRSARTWNKNRPRPRNVPAANVKDESDSEDEMMLPPSLDKFLVEHKMEKNLPLLQKLGATCRKDLDDLMDVGEEELVKAGISAEHAKSLLEILKVDAEKAEAAGTKSEGSGSASLRAMRMKKREKRESVESETNESAESESD